MCFTDAERLKEMIRFFQELNSTVEKTIASSFYHVSIGHQQTENTRKIVIMISKIFKRTTDLCMSLILLIMSFPIFIVVAIAVKLTSKGPVFFTQERIGYKNKKFFIYKFRTMRAETSKDDHKEYIKYLLKEGSQNSDEANLLIKHIAYIESRTTKVGAFLRATSLDELPQLLNIIKGDMSLVGPRPHPVYEVSEYKNWYYRRLEVKPGLTGWSKLNLRCTPKYYEEAILYDLWYVDHWTLWLDMLIMILTVPFVLSMKEAF